MSVEEQDGRRDGLPPELRKMLAAEHEADREAAWDRFVRRYNRLLLHAVHRQSPTYDMAMDRYAYVLEKLREDRFRRLRHFGADGTARFDTWLVVVARRLCIDHLRSHYGREQAERAGEENHRDAAHTARVRHRLADLLTEELDLDGVRDPSARDPDREVRRNELREALLDSLERLPARERLLVKLRFRDELKAREIARLMEYGSPFEVYRRVRKVLAALRRELEARGVDDPSP